MKTDCISIQPTLSGLYVVKVNGKEVWIGEYSTVNPMGRALANDLKWPYKMLPASKESTPVGAVVWKD